jgi:site-specific DNA-adenine methylase
MFSYFGSKSKLIEKYPKPTFYGAIVEPFAGSARYSLQYWDNDIYLYDINPTVINVWHYLQSASANDILGLPILKIGNHIDNFNLTQPEKDLIGFELCRGKAVPRKVVSKFSDWSKARLRIAENIHKIKHWKIELLNYYDIPDIKATYFIDPPYILKKETGMNYPFGHKQMDYNKLANWCKTRKGQVIVCGGTNDFWLPFNDLKQVKNGKKQGVEKIYLTNN